MGTDFLKFPTTTHLLWLASDSARSDKVLSQSEARVFLNYPVTVEEKVDGANLGISFDAHGNQIVQNRGGLVERGTKGQFAPLWAWLSKRETPLFNTLEDRFILFGEWCYARHSIHYTRLPDWFLAFDIFDKREQQFMSTQRRNALVTALQLEAVPNIKTGFLTLEEVPSLIGKSLFYDGPMEGIYLRYENASWLIERAKVVRAEFVQQIGDHWSKKSLVFNELQTSHVTG